MYLITAPCSKLQPQCRYYDFWKPKIAPLETIVNYREGISTTDWISKFDMVYEGLLNKLKSEKQIVGNMADKNYILLSKHDNQPSLFYVSCN